MLRLISGHRVEPSSPQEKPSKALTGDSLRALAARAVNREERLMPRWLLHLLCGVSLVQESPVMAQLSDGPSSVAIINDPAQGPETLPFAENVAPSAQVFFVNITEDWVILAQVIGDLLLKRQVIPRFEHRSQFTERDLLEQEQSRTQRRATVWVLMPQPQAARLVFADPELQRFLVREIPLPQGLDELGRESIAQVIESSALALLQGTTGMNRAEVRTALGPYLARATDPPRTFEHWRSSPLLAEPAGSKRSRRPWRPRIGLSYGLGLMGSNFGLQQGPGITSGLEFVRSTDSLFVTATLEWNFERHHQTSEFDLAVQNNLVWLLLGWRKPVRDSNFVAMLGPGLELSRVNPKLSTNDGSASVNSRLVHPSPWARVALGFEWDNSLLTLQLLGKIDVSAYRTHYDIDRNGNSEELASAWFIQPGFVLAALWR